MNRVTVRSAQQANVLPIGRAALGKRPHMIELDRRSRRIAPAVCGAEGALPAPSAHCPCSAGPIACVATADSAPEQASVAPLQTFVGAPRRSTPPGEVARTDCAERKTRGATRSRANRKFSPISGRHKSPIARHVQ